MTLPNFLIIGAQKSGTSSLFRYLKAHPQVFMSHIKEPKFFALEEDDFHFNAPYSMPDSVARIADFDAYQALFAEANGATAVGEASTWYLHITPFTPQKIKQYVPDMKILAILRHPIQRAYSNFLHNKDYLGIEPFSEFAQAVAAEAERRQQNWGHPWYYQDKGMYYKHLKPYFDAFGPEQIRVYLMEDLKADPVGLMQEIYRFLAIDDSFEPDVAQRFNVSAGNTRHSALHNFLNKPNPVKSLVRSFVPQRFRRQVKMDLQKRNRAKPKILPETREQLTAVFRPDIQQLQELLQRDLSAWLA